VAEAVGSDITNVLANSMRNQNFGAAITVLTQFLAFDVPVCVSQFTLDEACRWAQQVDDVLGTDFAARLKTKCALSYPALDVAEYTQLDPTVANAAGYRSVRKAALERFHRKREAQKLNPTVRYKSRKKIADNRPRIKGRFVKTDELVRAT
jgi:hypothetical protein